MFFLSDMLNRKLVMPAASEALPGRPEPIPTAKTHHLSGRPLKGPYPEGSRSVLFGMGSFRAAEQIFWQVDGVWVTAAGYAGGFTPNPTHQEVTTGLTGHAETVKVVYEPRAVAFAVLLRLFWECHDPTQGMRQGSDIGTAYRSAIFTTGEEQLREALATRDIYRAALEKAGHGTVTTEIRPAPEFYFAEAGLQQYPARSALAHAPPRGTGVPFGAIAAAPERDFPAGQDSR